MLNSRGSLEPAPGLLHPLGWYSSLSQLICSNTELLINAWSSVEACSWRIIYQVDPILQMGRCRGSAWVFTAARVTVPGERLGPGESLCDDQRWGRLPPIALIFHPLRKAKEDAKLKSTASLTDITLICAVALCVCATLFIFKIKKTAIKSWIVQTLHIHTCPCHYHCSPVSSVKPRWTHSPHQRDGGLQTDRRETGDLKRSQRSPCEGLAGAFFQSAWEFYALFSMERM